MSTDAVFENIAERIEEEILKSYFNFYKNIKDLTPLPLEKISPRKINLYLIGGVAFGLIWLVLYAFLWFKGR